MVVVHHIGILSQSMSLIWMTHISAPFAVQAFFVVSGFLVTMSYEKSRSLRSYASKRLRRIYPAYAVIVVVSAVALSLLSTLPIFEYFNRSEFWRYLAFNLALSNFVAPALPGVFSNNFTTAVNGALWTIKIEVAFYCLVPVLVTIARKAGYQRVLFAVFAASVLWKWGFSIAATATHSKIYAELAKQLPGQLSFFAGGAWAYYRSREGRGASVLLACLGVILYACVNGSIGDALQPLEVTAIVYWAAINCPRLPSLGKYGDFSYGTYLYHFPLVQVAIALGLFQLSPFVASAAVLTAVALCAVTSWYLIERPMLSSPSKAPTST
jgi:peptidoglycan/LPS O-acetylase OafA/YrhL